MTTAIGTTVRRKEDVRFLTGCGNDTDGINRSHRLQTTFVRTPPPLPREPAE